VKSAAGFQPIHPRKLYGKLVSSPSAEERARASLDFLCGCTGSTRGYLFLLRDQQLYEAANSGQGSPAADLLVEAERAWSTELDIEPDANRTRTIDTPASAKHDLSFKDQLWTGSDGVAYIRHVLGTYHGARWVPVGIAMLEAGAKLSPLRHAYIEVMCNAFIASGDIPAKPANSQLV
jgi:GAF domain-containing protein